MKIRTDQSLYQDRSKITYKIKNFWNKTSIGWRMVWGEHIHHGFYDSAERSPHAAQEKLIEKLIERLTLSPNTTLLDVGCGMGGSSIYLAKHYDLQVTGITISEEQLAIAKKAAAASNVKDAQFLLQDALSMSCMGSEKYDIVWSLESCEQFYDKLLFLQQAKKLLKPNGQLMLATWCSDRDMYEASLAKHYRKLCLAFDLPYMPTIAYYRNLLQSQGFQIKHIADWTEQVKKSWDVGISLANTYYFWQVLKHVGFRGLRLRQQLKLMQSAFKHGFVRYGVFIAEKT